MELNLQTIGDAGTAGTLTVADTIFAAEYKEGLIHQAVTAYLATGRSGSSAQKSRSDVVGGSAKPWRQKGTGRARAGCSTGPIWRGGGVTFAARPRSYEQKLNRKMYRGAMRSIVSELLRNERLVVVDSINIDQPKTKVLVNQLSAFDKGRFLLVDTEISENLSRSASNLYYVSLITPAGINPVNLVNADKVIITKAALQQIEERLS